TPTAQRWCARRELVTERTILRVGWPCGVGPRVPGSGAGPGRQSRQVRWPRPYPAAERTADQCDFYRWTRNPSGGEPVDLAGADPASPHFPLQGSAKAPAALGAGAFLLVI